MSNDKFNEYVPIEKFIGINHNYENPNQILEILEKPFSFEILKQPDYEDFLKLPTSAEYEKFRDENAVLLKERAEYVASEEYRQKLYEENVKFYEDLIAEAEKEISEDNVVVNDITDP